MSSNDEYSSDDGSIFDEEQNGEVFLGFADELVDENDEEQDPPSAEDTFIGGRPVWMHPDSTAPRNLLLCKSCNKYMALLAQVFAPLEGKLYDRVLYVFGCKDPLCSRKEGSIRCIKGICNAPEKTAQIKKDIDDEFQKTLHNKLVLDKSRKLADEITKDLFKKDVSSPDSSSNSHPQNVFNSSNPFASSSPFKSPFGAFDSADSEISKVGTFSTSNAETANSAPEVEKITDSSSKSKMASFSNEMPAYPCFFVSVEQETIKKQDTDLNVEKYSHLIEEGNGDLFSESSTKKKGKKKNHKGFRNESSGTLNAQNAKVARQLQDKYFESFTESVSNNPLQVIRYHIGGRPLLYSGRDKVASSFAEFKPGDRIFPPAFNPSSSRQFEFQLMPRTILELEMSGGKNVSFQDIMNGMSWGTIIVCTDIEDFIPIEAFDSNNVAYIEEKCLVQWEEL